MGMLKGIMKKTGDKARYYCLITGTNPSPDQKEVFCRKSIDPPHEKKNSKAFVQFSAMSIPLFRNFMHTTGILQIGQREAQQYHLVHCSPVSAEDKKDVVASLKTRLLACTLTSHLLFVQNKFSLWRSLYTFR